MTTTSMTDSNKALFPSCTTAQLREIVAGDDSRSNSHAMRILADKEINRRAAVDAAIASSNRAGRRIGGREAKMIHAVLKGRG
jgi:hypothetical protein